jgi:hypothetical protein
LTPSTKLFFHESLASAEDKNTRIVRARREDEIRRLKQGAGKKILIGGVAVPSQLIELGWLMNIVLWFRRWSGTDGGGSSGKQRNGSAEFADSA